MITYILRIVDFDNCVKNVIKYPVRCGGHYMDGVTPIYKRFLFALEICVGKMKGNYNCYAILDFKKWYEKWCEIQRENGKNIKPAPLCVQEFLDSDC